MKVWKTGGCHCGKVKFKVQDDFQKGIVCNCSICLKKGFLHLIVTKDNFEFLGDKNDLGTYTFGTHTAKHHFCKHCGISSFYVPRSHPDGFSVNLRCVEEVDLGQIKFESFDGKNWESCIHLLK